MKSWLLVIIYMSVEMESHFKLLKQTFLKIFLHFFFNLLWWSVEELKKTSLNVYFKSPKEFSEKHFRWNCTQLSLMSYERATYEQKHFLALFLQSIHSKAYIKLHCTWKDPDLWEWCSKDPLNLFYHWLHTTLKEFCKSLWGYRFKRIFSKYKVDQAITALVEKFSQRNKKSHKEQWANEII